MDTIHITMLIRGLFLVAMLSVLVLASVFAARREKDRSANPERDTPATAGRHVAATQGSSRYPSGPARPEANDPAAPAPEIHRRAA